MKGVAGRGPDGGGGGPGRRGSLPSIMLRTFLPAVVSALIAVASVPTTAGSQTAELGLKGGTAAASMFTWYASCGAERSDCVIATSPASPRRSASGGAFARVSLSDRLSAQAELLYVPKGYAVTSPTIHTDFIELPLLVRYEPFARSAVTPQPFLVAGTAPSFRVSCSVHYRTRIGEFEEPCGEDPVTGGMRTVNRADLGVVVGAGAAVLVPPGRMSLEMRYTRSVLDNGVKAGAEKSIHRVFSVLFGYSVLVH